MIRVYRYGLPLGPTVNAELVRQQIRNSHHYRNTLTEIERARRASMRELLSAQGNTKELEQTVADAKNAELEIVQQIKSARSDSRKKDESQELKERLAAARILSKAARQNLFEQRRQLREDASLQAAKDAIDERAAEARRNARAKCDVFWGTYLLIEDADQASRKIPLYDGAEPNDPRFTRFTGEGRIGVQLQGGLPIAKLFENDTRIQVNSVSENAWHAAKSGDRRRAMRTILRMRIGSEGRAPIWAEWPMIMHRRIPDGSILKGAVVNLRKVGPREQWWVTITAELPEAKFRTCGRGTVAVDLGWRQFEDGLRVAAWGTTGESTVHNVTYNGRIGKESSSGELRLPFDVIAQIRKADELRSIRDTAFDIAKMRLANFLTINSNVPEWLKTETLKIDKWRSQGRLAGLVNRWKKEVEARIEIRKEVVNGSIRKLVASIQASQDPAMNSILRELEEWRLHDYHLWEWESAQRKKALGHRREIYRIFAYELARRFETLVLEDFDLREIAKKQDVEDVSSDNQTSRSNRQLAAVSELRLCLINAFGGRGGTIEKVSSKDTTITCNNCGHVEKFDAATYVAAGCNQCGNITDQDVRAWRNMLVSHSERQRDEQNMGSARTIDKSAEVLDKTASRWSRAKKMAEKKRVRQGTARDVDHNDAE